MSEEKKVPVLSIEQKFRIAVAHRNYVKAESNFTTAQINFATEKEKLTQVVNAVATELGITEDGPKYDINVDTFDIVEKN